MTNQTPNFVTTDLMTIVRSQLTAVEALNRIARIRARISVTMDVIARAEAQIRTVRELLDSERNA